MSKQLEWRKFLAIVLGAAIVSVLLPVGVQAAVEAVKIQDADSTAKAQIDQGGRLRVGDGAGPMTVDGEVDLTGGYSSPAEPFQARIVQTANPDCPVATDAVNGFTVPAGKTLVIRHVSYDPLLQDPKYLEATFNGRSARVYFSPSQERYETDTPLAYASGGTQVTAAANCRFSVDITVVGYLI